MGTKLAGDALMKIDGSIYEIADISANVGTEEREGIVSTTGVVGYKVRKRAAYVSGTLIITSDTDVDMFNAISGNTVAVQYADGSGYALENAWLTEPLEHDGAEGTAAFRIEAMTGTRILAPV